MVKSGRPAPRSKALNKVNLTELGAETLAELLIDVTTGNARAKQKVRLALAAGSGAGAAASEIRKRLTAISKSRTFVNWRNRRKLVADMKAQLDAIEAHVTPSDPLEAVELLWRFLALARPVFDRTDDSSGTVIGIFHKAVEELGRVADLAKADPLSLTERIADALETNGYGEADDLIPSLAPALGSKGLAALRSRVQTWRDRRPDDRMTHIMTSLALQQIADAEGDVDAYIAEFEREHWSSPDISKGIATRLLSAGRAAEALEVIDAVDPDQQHNIPEAWEHVRADVLRAVGRTDEAAAWHKACFAHRLSPDHLRAYLKTLPDFDNDEAEEMALAEVAGAENVHKSLMFLLNWGAVILAGEVVRQRSEALNGDYYELLGPAAEALADKDPLAATLCLRAMIDFTLNAARSTRYGHAARHLTTCYLLAEHIEGFAPTSDHETYVGELRDAHPRKSGFWRKVEDAS